MKYYFFDMDGTICESRQKISLGMKKKLTSLENVIVISGASRRQMEYQLDGLKCTILSQSGNDTPLWKNELTTFEKSYIFNHIDKFGNSEDYSKAEDRGCQIAYSFVGHNRSPYTKKNFDSKQKIREIILKEHPFKSKTLQVTIAGTTCLDYTKKNGTKGINLARWMKENKLNKKNCIYYGDSLFKGGNDATVLRVMKCIKVKNPNDLLKNI